MAQSNARPEAGLSKSVIETDARLEKAQSRSLEELAQHRWRWTLDETNPDRVSIREYARQIGRSLRAVQNMVKGYASWKSDEVHLVTLHEAIDRASVGTEKEAVVEAIAKAEGVAFQTARQRHEEVREVRTIAQERAERRGTSIEEEAPFVAEQRVKARAAGARIREERVQAKGLRYIEIEGHLAAAQQRLSQALTTAQDIGWEAEEIELLADSLGKIRAILNLIDLRIAGETNVDWDQELQRLTREG